jgi:hypothetical protein
MNEATAEAVNIGKPPYIEAQMRRLSGAMRTSAMAQAFVNIRGDSRLQEAYLEEMEKMFKLGAQEVLP